MTLRASTSGPLCFLAALLLACFSPALERANLRFYLSFEDGIAPAVAGGRPGAETPIKFHLGSPGDVEIVPGLRGAGLRAKPGLFLQYLTRESFSLKHGTIAFWVKPLGWSGLREGHTFLYVRSDQVALHFTLVPGNVYYYVDNCAGSYYLINTAEDGNQRDPFRDGEWTFLAGTFKPGEQRFYINGYFMNAMTTGVHEPVFSSKGVVEIPEGNQVLDEIMIFDRVLTDKEINAIYKANLR